MDKETVEGLSRYRQEKAKETLKSAKLLYDNDDLIGANNRAYYAIFYSIRAILALENKDFKRHKDVIAYFNQYYINTEIFPRKIGKKIAQAQTVRENSDYDDQYQPSYEKTKNQINTASELIELVDTYLEENIHNKF